MLVWQSGGRLVPGNKRRARRLLPRAVGPRKRGRSALSRLLRRRLERELDAELRGFLSELSARVRAGAEPLSALLELKSGQRKGSLLFTELSRLKEALQQGDSDSAALELFGRGNADLELLRAALLFSRKEGAALSPALSRLLYSVRRRQRIRRRVRAGLAAQKLSVLGIGVLSIGIGILQYLFNQEALLKAAAHPTGALALWGAAMLVVCGFLSLLHLAASGERAC